LIFLCINYKNFQYIIVANFIGKGSEAMKKGLTIFLIFLFTLINVFNPGLKAFAVEDLTPPTFNSVSVSKKTALPGDEIKISINASDLESGLSFAYINYLSPENEMDYLYMDSANEKLECLYRVNPYQASGTWQVDSIVIFDNNHNSTIIYNSQLYGEEYETADLSGGNFTVTGTTFDHTPPVLLGVSTDKKAAIGGDIVKVTFNAFDAVSGIDAINFTYQGAGGLMGYNARLEDGKFVGYVLVGQYHPQGEWKIRYVTLIDKANNGINYENINLATPPYSANDIDLSGGDFTVSGTIVDNADPALTSVTINKNTAAVGNSLVISLNASDSESGINIQERSDLWTSNYNWVSNVEFVSPLGYKRKALLKKVNDTYQAFFNVGPYTEPGVWKISKVMIYDKAGNVAVIGNSSYSGNTGLDKTMNMDSANFTVSGTTLDTTFPIVNKVSINKSLVNAKEYVKLIVDAQDAISGLKQGRRDYDLVAYDGTSGSSTCVEYLSPQGEIIGIDLKLQDGQYYADVLAPEFNSNGTWKLAAVTIMDGAGNMTTVGNSALTAEEAGMINISLGKGKIDTKIDLSGGNFVVQNGVVDKSAPTLKSVSLSSSSIAGAGKVQLTLDIEDTGSGVGDTSGNGLDYGHVVYSSSEEYGYKYGDIRLENNKYVFDFEVNQFDVPGVWKIENILLSDKANNYVYIGNTNNINTWDYDIPMDLSAGDITVSGTSYDITPPKVQGVTVSKASLPQGSTAVVTVSASDDLSGLSEGGYMAREDRYFYSSIEYISPSGKKKNVLLKLNNGKYVGTLEFGNFEETGLWRVHYIDLSDKAGNNTIVFNSRVGSDNYYDFADFSAGDITITGTTVDSKAPSLTSITIDRKMIGPSDTLKVTVKAADDLSGVHRGMITYVSPSGEQDYCFLSLVNGELVGYFTASEWLKADLGLWQPYKLKLFDKVDNSTIIGNYKYTLLPLDSVDSISDMSGGDFTLASTSITEDVNGDGAINLLDLANAAKLYNTNSGSSGWSPACDINKDNIIDIIDLVRISKKIQ
jgi:hypothetical protein